MYKIIILNIIFLAIIFFYYTIKNKLCIKFIDKNKLANILIDDEDKFYSSLSDTNLLLRNINNKNEFLTNINKYLYSCNLKEQNIIIKAIKKADTILNNIKYPGFKYSKLKKYDWIIGCSIGTEYEFGYPHTRNNIIILNYNNIYDNDLYKTLIHERIHIYQKYFPDDIELFLQHFNFKKTKLQHDRHLANPDTDNYIYTFNNNDLECIIKKKIDNSFDLHYTNNNYKLEHPFEFMAYLIAEYN